jgi:hypothetical protein
MKVYRTIEQQVDFIIAKQDGDPRAAIAYLIGALNSSEAIVERAQDALRVPKSNTTSAWLAWEERP